MNLAHANIAIRQRSVLESVDLSLPFVLRLGKGVYLRLMLATLLPCWITCGALGYALKLHWAWLWLIALIMHSLLQGVFTLTAGQLVFEESVSARQILKKFLRKLPSYATGLLYTRTLIALSSVTFLLLLPITWVRLAYAHEVMLLEGATLKSLWSRCSALVKGQTGPALQMLTCVVSIVCASILCSELLGLGLVSYLLQLGSPFGSLFEDGGSLFALFGLFVSTPLIATARFLTFIDGRTRRDAWDVQVRFQQVRAEAKVSIL